jgi:hypothetical protein
MPPTIFGVFAGVEQIITGIDSLRRKGEEEILSDPQAATFELGQDKFVRGAGIRRTFQDNELAGVQVLPNLFGCG